MNSAVSEPVLIGLDWGTSSLRAYLIGKGGAVLDGIASDQGIMHVPGGDFDRALQRLIAPWRSHGILPVIASGMITSRNGWVETPYVAVPGGAKELAGAVVVHVTADRRPIHFITGVTTEHDGAPDVMRGEETQIVGAVAMGMGDGTYVMPGTHSKWAQVSGGVIDDYRTYMTGELFGAIKGHTILATLMAPGDFSEDGFRQGVRAALKSGGELLHNLFHVRTMPLFGKMSGAHAADYLSGLLIGAEIASGTRAARGEVLTVIGRGDLADRYEIALDCAGSKSRRAPEHICARGHYEIAKAAGLVS